MPEQDPSRYEAFKDKLSSAVDFAKEKTAITLMSAAVLSGGVAVEQAIAEPVTPQENNPEATASSLKQECIEAGLSKPKVYVAAIYNAGKYLQQVDSVYAGYRNMPPGCKGHYKEVAKGLFQAKGRGDGHWRDIMDSPEGIWQTNSDYIVGFTTSPSSHEPRNDNYYLRRGEVARLILKNKVVNNHGKVIGEKQFAYKSKVYHGVPNNPPKLPDHENFSK